jgi:hypothetical protein
MNKVCWLRFGTLLSDLSPLVSEATRNRANQRDGNSSLKGQKVGVSGPIEEAGSSCTARKTDPYHTFGRWADP